MTVFRAYLRPALFTAAVSTLSFGIASKYAQEKRHDPHHRLNPKLGMSNADAMQYIHRLKTIQRFPEFLREPSQTLLKAWTRLSAMDKLVYSIVAINTGVFLAWRIPRLHQRMMYHFMHRPGHSPAYTLLTSAFSHHEPWHFAFNMIALTSFMKPLAHTLDVEEVGAVYITAALVSSLGSHYASLARYILSRGTYEIIPSLGASGAVFALFGLNATLFPHQKVSLIFLPFIPVDIQTMLYGVMALDATGVVLGWRLFDHVAHLSGALFGLWYASQGHAYWQHNVYLRRDTPK